MANITETGVSRVALATGGSAAAAVPVDASNPLPVSMSGSGAAASRVQGNTASGAADTGDPVKIGGRYNATAPTVTDGQRVDVQTDNRGYLKVVLIDSGGTQTTNVSIPGDGTANSVGGMARVLNHNMHFNGTTWDRMRKPSAASRIVSAAASTNATVAKASAGDLYTVRAHNAAAALRFLKIYNKATAPTVGTDIPVMTIPLPIGSSIDVDFVGHYFSAGISYALTVNAADSDTTALTAADVIGLLITYA